MRGVMSDLPGASQYPLDVDSVECSPLGREKVVIRLTGTWRGRRRAPDGRALLVVEADGRRHRFPAIPEPRRARVGRPGMWAASFALPAWLEPRLGGQMSLWLGNVAIPLPPVSFVDAEPGEDPAARPTRPPAPARRPRMDPPPPPPPPRAPDVDPSDALAERIGHLQAGLDEAHREADRLRDLLAQRDRSADVAVGHDPALDDTVAALRGELQERAASEASLRSTLARAQAELDARSDSHSRMEATYAELRGELEQLTTLVGRESAQREEVESRAVVFAAEAAELQQQVEDLRAERDQASAESARAQHELEARESGLAGQVSALRAQLAESEVSRDAAQNEAQALRTELERLGTQLASHQASLAPDPGLGEAESLLAEARELTARLTSRADRST